MTEPRKLIVIQYEQFFRPEDGDDLHEAMRDSLEAMQQSGGARVVGSYEIEDTEEWHAQAVDSIEVTSPMTVHVPVT